MSRAALFVAVALPPLVLAGLGVTHPTDLTPSSAVYWRDLHVVTLVFFPLLAFAPYLVIRGHFKPMSAVVGAFGFLYATFYTALDVLSGIGAGALEHAGHTDATSTLSDLGTALGEIGSWAYVLAALGAGFCSIMWSGIRAIPGSVLILAGSLLFLERHIYFPVGVIGQVLLAVGFSFLLVSGRHRRTRGPGVPKPGVPKPVAAEAVHTPV